MKARSKALGAVSGAVVALIIIWVATGDVIPISESNTVAMEAVE